MLRFEDVSFQYAEAVTVSHLDFHIRKGDFTALIGANGAGKSTISKLCNGLLKPTSGRVLVRGRDSRTAKTSQLSRFVGFLFQNPDRQICQNTIREEILFGLEYAVDDPAERQERCERTLSLFGFDGSRDPFGMSRGERQRIALASLLACGPEILILDEPTTGLDYQECMQIMEIIRQLNEQGATILMVTHDMEIVQDFAKRVLVVSGGRLLADGPMETVMTDRALLAKAHLLPPQIMALALRLGPGYEGAYTVDAMTDRIVERSGR